MFLHAYFDYPKTKFYNDLVAFIRTHSSTLILILSRNVIVLRWPESISFLVSTNPWQFERRVKLYNLSKAPSASIEVSTLQWWCKSITWDQPLLTAFCCCRKDSFVAWQLIQYPTTHLVGRLQIMLLYSNTVYKNSSYTLYLCAECNS